MVLCEYPVPIEGCMDVNATNYNSTVEIDDNSCEYPVPIEVVWMKMLQTTIQQ